MAATARRIMKEAKDFREKPRRDYLAYPMEDNMFEWVFLMRGPEDTEYADGFYRGRVRLPNNYPFAPPDIYLLTPNGRFEVDKKICVSITSYHPENWNATWGIGTVLGALRQFMSTPGNNAVAAIEYSAEKRRKMAAESVDFYCPVTEKSIKDEIQQLNDAPEDHLPPSAPSTPDVPPKSAPDAPPPMPADGEKKGGAGESPAAAAEDAPAPANDGAAGGEGAAEPQAEGARPAGDAARAAEARAAAPEPPRREEEVAIIVDESCLNFFIAILSFIVFLLLMKKSATTYMLTDGQDWTPKFGPYS